MVDVLVLPAKQGLMRMELVELPVRGGVPFSWLRCYLQQETEILLGAEIATDIAARLRKWLLADPKPGLTFIMTLWETHCTLYGVSRVPNYSIGFQDEHGVFFAHLVLTPEERADWISRLDGLPETLQLMLDAGEQTTT